MKRVGIVGCGLIGARRARVAAAHPESTVVWVVDPDGQAAQRVADEVGAVRLTQPDLSEVDAVVVATPNGLAPGYAREALEAGKQVLMEKPMGRRLAEARELVHPDLKIGFNHRYHPALSRARALLAGGKIGELVSIRARYGHGGRPGYEKEWRGDPELAGGGVLLDQGVHIADLVHWFAGLPSQAMAITQNVVWPIAPLEDSAFALLKWDDGKAASFHVAWTQWKNMFSFEVFGTQGSLVVDGLGGSYGTERLTVAVRKPEGGVPHLEEEEFPGPDRSWELEWEDFLAGAPGWGTAHDGLQAMRMLDGLFASASAGMPQSLKRPALFLDRDGILSEVVRRGEVVGSARTPEEFRLIAAAAPLVRRARQNGFVTVLVTNQPDVERGLLSRERLQAFHHQLRSAFALDHMEVCESGDDRDPRRKPNPGMLLDAARTMQLDLGGSFFLGDTGRDVEAARRAGVKSILLKTDYNADVQADFVAENYEDALRIVMEASSR